jgi:hypothetical protein
MHREQYKRAYHLYRLIQLLEKQILPNSDNAYEYIWHQIKQMTSQISSLDAWCVMEHYDNAHRIDIYEDYNWVWFRLQPYVAINVEKAFRGKAVLGNFARLEVSQHVQYWKSMEMEG